MQESPGLEPALLLCQHVNQDSRRIAGLTFTQGFIGGACVDKHFVPNGLVGVKTSVGCFDKPAAGIADRRLVPAAMSFEPVSAPKFVAPPLTLEDSVTTPIETSDWRAA